MDSNYYDVIIIGGGVIGSSAAYFLSAQKEFKGSILVVEKDPTYERSSTTLSAGGIRQQFSTKENIQISKFGINFLKNIKNYLSEDGFSSPKISFIEGGYLFLATGAGVSILNQNYNLQKSLGSNIVLLSPDELNQQFPWLNVSDLAGGSLGLENEGWFDPYSLLMGFVRKAKSMGVFYLKEDVKGIEKQKNKVSGIILSNGKRISCKYVINASGPYAAQIAEMAEVKGFPVQPRKRFIYVFNCREKIINCPLVIDPNGVYFRPEGHTFICGVSPPENRDPECLDFKMDYFLFEEIIWPTLANRVPAFEAIKRGFSWAGHYAYNIYDQNVILGFHPEIDNFLLANGFSGHGLQQAPAIGRAISELITFGSYQTIDLTKFSFERFAQKSFIKEINVV